MKSITKVAVLGSGVMGATIAAHLTHAGLTVLMLDLPSAEGDKNATANKAKAALAKMKPAPMYGVDYLDQIQTGNFEDDLARLKDFDWIIEVVVERMEIKKKVLAQLVPILNNQAVLSTNTSGLSINEMAQGLPLDLQKRFLVTHFFNPPRYMRLMELVPCQNTDPALLAFMAKFIANRLGKGIVFAKDTTNFIANRIGVFSIYNAMQHMVAQGLSIEAVDAVAGPATARPKSAAFRTSDLVGIDTMVHVGNNSYDTLPNDEARLVFQTPGFVKTLLEQGHLGDKTGQGFFKKTTGPNGERLILHLDWKTGDYLPPAKPRFKSIGNAKSEDNPSKRLKKLFEIDDEASRFAWLILRDCLLYSYNRIPEIADDLVNIDNAMKWGFNWEIGPFEMFDALGVEWFVERAKTDGIRLPEGLEQVASFYRYSSGIKEYWSVTEKVYKPVPVNPEEIRLEILHHKSGGVIEKTANCSILDLGDGVFGLEFHSKMNVIAGDILNMTVKATQRAESEGVGLVIANQGVNFSVGANLALLTMAIIEGEWDDISLMIRQFQRATMALKYSKVPTVVAPFHLSLGGGCEFSLHADAINAYAETWMGLVEIGVGLLPAGGGTKEMCLRATDLAKMYETDVSPFIFKYFGQIGLAKVSTSAKDLFSMGYMRPGDGITMNLANLVADAKARVLGLATNYIPKSPRCDIPAPGKSVAASIQNQLWNMVKGGYATEYEFQLGKTISHVITGGEVSAGNLISEEYLLELELEGFLKLCGNKKTLERIQHTLKTGKPLRN